VGTDIGGDGFAFSFKKFLGHLSMIEMRQNILTDWRLTAITTNDKAKLLGDGEAAKTFDAL
jgi:hypothetical protein